MKTANGNNEIEPLISEWALENVTLMRLAVQPVQLQPVIDDSDRALRDIKPAIARAVPRETLSNAAIPQAHFQDFPAVHPVERNAVFEIGINSKIPIVEPRQRLRRVIRDAQGSGLSSAAQLVPKNTVRLRYRSTAINHRNNLAKKNRRPVPKPLDRTKYGEHMRTKWRPLRPPVDIRARLRTADHCTFGRPCRASCRSYSRITTAARPSTVRLTRARAGIGSGTHQPG